MGAKYKYRSGNRRLDVKDWRYDLPYVYLDYATAINCGLNPIVEEADASKDIGKTTTARHSPIANANQTALAIDQGSAVIAGTSARTHIAHSAQMTYVQI